MDSTKERERGRELLLLGAYRVPGTTLRGFHTSGSRSVVTRLWEAQQRCAHFRDPNTGAQRQLPLTGFGQSG